MYVHRSKEVKKDLNPVWGDTCQILLDELTVAWEDKRTIRNIPMMHLLHTAVRVLPQALLPLHLLVSHSDRSMKTTTSTSFLFELILLHYIL